MKSIYAIATLSGTIIGAGLFALPHITFQVGFWVILAYFLVLGSLITLIHIFFAELALKTPDLKRLPGFAKIYLGRRGEIVAYTSTVLSLFGAILAYIILGGEFLSRFFYLFSSGVADYSEINVTPYMLLYFSIGAALIFFGIKAIEKVEFWGLIIFLIFLFVIFFLGIPFISIENIGNLFVGFGSIGAGQWSTLFLPYGIILFSLWGAALIPEIEEMLGRNKQRIFTVIPVSILIPVLVYLFFACVMLGFVGENITDKALFGLEDYVGNNIAALALLFGLLTTFTSFIALGLTLKKVFWYDLGFSKKVAWATTCFVPLVLYLVGVQSFIFVIGFVGAVMLAIDGILILLMYNKTMVRYQASKIKGMAVYPLILVLFGGIVYTIVELIHSFGESVAAQ